MTIQGKITDAVTGEALPGVNLAVFYNQAGNQANIIEHLTGEGTTTDADGRYSLVIPDMRSLKVSMVGYNTRKFGPTAPELKPLPMVTDIQLYPASYGLPEATATAARTYWREAILGTCLLGLIVAGLIALNSRKG